MDYGTCIKKVIFKPFGNQFTKSRQSSVFRSRPKDLTHEHTNCDGAAMMEAAASMSEGDKPEAFQKL